MDKGEKDETVEIIIIVKLVIVLIIIILLFIILILIIIIKIVFVLILVFIVATVFTILLAAIVTITMGIIITILPFFPTNFQISRKVKHCNCSNDFDKNVVSAMLFPINGELTSPVEEHIDTDHKG